MNKETLINEIIATVREKDSEMPSWANYWGLRYDNKVVEVGEELAESKSNFDRDDSRDFPQFDSDEYKDLDGLGGTSVYGITCKDDVDFEDDDEIENLRRQIRCFAEGKEDAAWDHCSLVWGCRVNDAFCEDNDEEILDRPEVVRVFW